MSFNEENEQLSKDMQELKNSVQQLSNEIEVLKNQKARPALTPGIVGQIGGILLGAIVLLGIFWR